MKGNFLGNQLNTKAEIDVSTDTKQMWSAFSPWNNLDFHGVWLNKEFLKI